MRRVLVLFALLAGCASTIGRPIPWDAVSAFQRGTTTAREAVAALGPAAKVEAAPAGGMVYTWEHLRVGPFGSSHDVVALAFDQDGRLVSEPPRR